MKNRESLYPGRVKLTPVDAANGIYDMIRADEPQDPGTPLNKKLLDFAVAACGVTAGTATAYTLDDEFGGFELANGAKVSFQLHVASGVNPTLNINGTGYKPIVDVFGTPLLHRIPAGIWIEVIYSSAFDSYVIVGYTRPQWTDTILSASASIQVKLPEEYEIIRLRASLNHTMASTWTSFNIGSDIAFTYYVSGVYNGSIVNANSYGTSMSAQLAFGPKTGVECDLLINRYNGKNTIRGTINSGRGVVGFSAYNDGGSFNDIRFEAPAVHPFAAGSTIILEGIA